MLFLNLYNEKREILQRFSRVFNRWKLNIGLELFIAWINNNHRHCICNCLDDIYTWMYRNAIFLFDPRTIFTQLRLSTKNIPYYFKTINVTTKLCRHNVRFAKTFFFVLWKILLLNNLSEYVVLCNYISIFVFFYLLLRVLVVLL